MNGCGDNLKVKYSAGSFIYKELTWWNTQVQTRGREAALGMTWEDFKTLMREVLCLNNEMQKLETKLVPHLVTLENKRIERYIYGLALHIYVMVAATEPIIIQSVVLKARMLTDEAIRNASLKKNTEKRGKGGEPSRDGNVKDDNKRSRTGKAFAIITNPIRKEYTGPRMVNLLNARNDKSSSVGSAAQAEIVCQEKVVRIPLPSGEILRVLGESPEEKVRHHMSAKAEEQKLKDIIVIRNFSKVFLDDLSGLPPSREIEFRIDLTPGAMLVPKSPYCSVPSEMEE
ncbi:hypothetical protein Tco_0537394 [Tanacetum coccineum]